MFDPIKFALRHAQEMRMLARVLRALRSEFLPNEAKKEIDDVLSHFAGAADRIEKSIEATKAPRNKAKEPAV